MSKGALLKSTHNKYVVGFYFCGELNKNNISLSLVEQNVYSRVMAKEYNVDDSTLHK